MYTCVHSHIKDTHIHVHVCICKSGPIVATPVILTGSGIVRGMHVGSYAPSQYTSTPLRMYFFDVYLVHI